MKNISTAVVFLVVFMVVMIMTANSVFAKWGWVSINFDNETLEEYANITNNLTNEFEEQGVVFSDNDSDLPFELQKSLGYTGQENLIFEGNSLYNIFRLDFVNTVRQVRLTLRDSNLGSQDHCLYAINADGTIIDVDCINDGGFL